MRRSFMGGYALALPAAAALLAILLGVTSLLLDRA